VRDGDQILNKSGFLRGWQCPKALYYSVFEPGVAAAPDPASLARMAAGRRIGLLARELFPDGQEAWPHRPFDLLAAAERTRSMIADRVPAIFEGVLTADDGRLAAVDILARGRRGWRLIEVKSSTSVKDEHLPDVAFQWSAASAAGVEIESAEVLHLNPNYVRRGALDVSALFKGQRVTSEAEALLPEVDARAADLRRLLREGRLPDIPIGPHCYQPRECDCRDACWAEVPRGSVLEIAYLTWEKKFHLYDQGMRRIEDVPPEIELPKRSRLHVKAHQGGRSIIDAAGLRAFVEGLAFPIHLLDFETVAPGVPLWDGTRPYQQIPFQYSLHVLQSPGSEPEHSGFLAEPGPDPRPALLRSLLPATIGSGSILAYHMPFELGVMRNLAEAFPDFRDEIAQRLPRMDDLIKPFRSWQYWLPEMGGSFSIKSVAPALDPELRYAGLEIADGQVASLAFEQLISGAEPAQAGRLRTALEVYCERDTLAMVRVLQAVWRAAGGG
jgi:hypothetical protein